MSIKSLPTTLSEAGIINKLKTAFPDYIGDDAAVIAVSPQESYVISKDMLIEDIHFRIGYGDAVRLAKKSLAVNLSDIAAMGAKAEFVLLGIAIPPTLHDYATIFLDAFIQACFAASIIIIGGDTTRSCDKLVLSLTIIGRGQTATLKYRHLAHPQDRLCVVGQIGHAHIGFLACEQRITGCEHYGEAWLSPKPKLEEGLWLAQQCAVQAMMDISDGLAIDTKKLCIASNVKGIIDLDLLPLCPDFVQKCCLLGQDPHQVMLIGGEDYGLLIAIAPHQYAELCQQFQEKFSYSLIPVGHLEHGQGLEFIKNGKLQALTLNPYTHFDEAL